MEETQKFYKMIRQINPLHDDIKNQNKPSAVCIVGFIEA